MSVEQIEINTTEYLVTLQDGSNLQTLEITEGVQLDVLLSEMGLQGPAGPAGKSITSVVKTSTVGLVDTYTITFSDSTTQTFTVTNGADGIDGSVISVAGKTGAVVLVKADVGLGNVNNTSDANKPVSTAQAAAIATATAIHPFLLIGA